jgi:hypothetical protein
MTRTDSCDFALVPPENVAVTLLFALMVTEQVGFAPLQAPPQLLKVAAEEGVAVSVTVEPVVSFALQTVLPFPQLIPPPDTSPLPVTETLSTCVFVPPPPPPPPPGPLENVALTVFAAFIVTMQVFAVPLQAPPQPVKVEPVSGASVSVTVEPEASLAEQSEPPAEVQVRPPPETLPLPETLTLSGNVWLAATKVAFTVLSAVRLTVQVLPDPEQAPLQPPKV